MAESIQLNKKIDDLTATVNRMSKQFDEYMIENDMRVVQVPGQNTKEKRVDFSKDENEDRGNWSGRLDFLLACLGYAVGLGNVWRFPYLCYKNGGAVFFIPYVIMLFLVGMPIFFLELSLGQYTSSGPLTCWEMAPLFKGIGIGMTVVSGLVGIYYNMIIAWAIFYLFASFTSDLPWQYCDREWNSPWCKSLIAIVNETACVTAGWNATYDGVCYNGSTPKAFYNESLAAEFGRKRVLPSEEYLNRYVLGTHNANGLHDMGKMKWQLVLCLILAWVIVSLSLINGIKSSGKVVYFTALFPYAVLIILLIRGLLLPGYYEGIRFYILEPDLSKLKNAQVWKDAAVQIFFSLSASWGGLIALASYNRFHNDCLRDSLIVSLGNCLTSFFAGFVIFSFLGFLAQDLGVEVKDVAESGPGLAFIVYPDAVTRMPISPLWAILFFMMLITLGLDSEFALVETVTTGIFDQWPQTRKRKWAVILTCAVVMFLLGLSLCMEGGLYMLNLMDTYSGGWNVLLIALFECIAISYVYGVMRFKEDIRLMVGNNPCGCWNWNCFSPWWIICWSLLTPLGVLFVMVFSWVDYTPLTEGDYEYEEFNILGWLMTFVVIAGIFVGGIAQFFFVDGTFGERLHQLTHPTEKWGPALVKHRRHVTHLPNFVIDPNNEEGQMGTVSSRDVKVHDGAFQDGIDGLGYE